MIKLACIVGTPSFNVQLGVDTGEKIKETELGIFQSNNT